MSTDILHKNRKVWDKKPVLRHVYQDFYNRILHQMDSGTTLEIGGGGGNFSPQIPDGVITDIVPLGWLDCVCDAQKLPFKESVFQSIVMVDVLHHIEYPAYFLEEAERVLKKGGRLIMVEPAMTFLGRFFYHHFHEEPVDIKVGPFAKGMSNPNKLPFDSNQALPYLLFHKYKAKFHQKNPGLNIKICCFFSLWAYPLSGGFQPWSLLPGFLVRPLLKLESFLEPILARYMGFRMLVVIEKL